MNDILLIEDSADDARTVRAALDRAGLANPVRHIDDGATAIAFLTEAERQAISGTGDLPAILLIDIKLPNRDGFEILEWLRQHPAYDKSLKIVISAMEDIRDINKAYRLGAHSFLLKPTSATDIQGVVNAFRGYWIFCQGMAQSKP